jgi:hypothetical protein
LVPNHPYSGAPVAKRKPEVAKPTFSGALAEPIIVMPTLLGRLFGEDSPPAQAFYGNQEDEVAELLSVKMLFLLDHYRIGRDDHDKWHRLAFALARDFVPGFSFVLPQPVGAPMTWGVLELAELFLDIESRVDEGQSAMDACRALLRNSDGGWRYPRCRSVKTLYRRYQEAKASQLVIFMSTPVEGVPLRDGQRAMLKMYKQALRGKSAPSIPAHDE